MKVRIYTEKQGWIFNRCAKEIKDYFERHGHRVDINESPTKGYNINYFINFGYYQKFDRGIDVAMYAHLEEDKTHPMYDRYIESTSYIDYAVCPSEFSAQQYQSVSGRKARVIHHGVDEVFKPKTRLGIVGRTYPSGRKGEHLVAQLLKDDQLMEKFDVVVRGEGWPIASESVDDEGLEGLAKFYQSLDYLLVPSLMEGFHMPTIEALACGVRVIGPEVGVIPEVPHVHYERGDYQSLRSVLLYLPRRRNLLPAGFTWEGWGEKHLDYFKEILNG